MGRPTTVLGVGAIPTSGTSRFRDEGTGHRGCIPTWSSMAFGQQSSVW
ncbi:unnamed protein product [Linum tenue]|uniref:Uncharacterized protein n=1 Tax=Linum tenue TaxID=586396 RepID=A0AAV0J4N4_9ROSI|nr:unnamed protein product [Linum tenue]